MDLLNRCCIGLRFPPELHAEIQQNLLLVKRKPGIIDTRWSNQDEILLNLVPLGELSPATIVRVRDVAAPLLGQIHRFNAEFAGFGGVPNPTQPRYCTLQFSETYGNALVRLAAHLETHLLPLVAAREAKPFQPHITLGRIKTESETLRTALGRAIKASEVPAFSPLVIDRFELLASFADSNGTHYKAIETFALA